ncbi:uncharacterized protein LOC114936313 [Nylanderia fulva]|uniref:uncharacterized protein LOC114936313 n=1 Tax=Nylanderia fulva TaxID=613905 RepID=UPI0010FAF58C|nr:uncharacterized protein LOC114936313 [Nylanderia fulva]XP_029165318.1 uncharacterized protein LOC114936313 [Nylanderia fulva]XP_029165319.1 uncharacterized protein LOC114936313 [Nylanderia fulva]XP_029165320.1 uncharacterized protein LOC114936313 [Nylanderia fulva]XP_029165321.1 uncharacterized protein LOC114936313 [Nylanderia fulva]XP_029165322.1 uncharacterized protein LOC114936313 [Nylanderia fulva]XP_029165324.1 uncharacterized protein LOC114936313 [Nylanderia fulva]XP_029165325.1 unc
MAQGKLKVKTKVPASVKTKTKKIKKGPAIQRRGNAPVQPKKTKLQETQKLKKMISKTVNKTIEDELREAAMNGKKTLAKKGASSSQKK